MAVDADGILHDPHSLRVIEPDTRGNERRYTDALPKMIVGRRQATAELCR
jgi:hypothetical protein